MIQFLAVDRRAPSSAFLARDRPARRCSPARAVWHGLSRRPSIPRLILRQMVDIGYFSLPVVGLTALFTGMVLALQILYRLQPLQRRERDRHRRRAVGDARTRPGDRRADGGRPRRRRHGGRDRHDARHRADRRADDAVDRPAALSRRCRACSPGLDHAAVSWCSSPTSSACSAAIWSASTSSTSTRRPT